MLLVNFEKGVNCRALVQVKELLLPFGSLKAFNLVMDKNTGNSKVTLPIQCLAIEVARLQLFHSQGADSISQ